MARPRKAYRRDLARPEEGGISMKDAAAFLATALTRQAVEPNMYAYDPHNKQVDFHKAETTGRLYLGGNRSGKSTAGIVEDLWWLSKKHPYLRMPSDLEIRGRAVGSDFTSGVEQILIPMVKRWILPSMLIGGSWEDSFDRELRTLHLTDGSFLEFKSSDQELQKHAGTSRHFVHFDEEPPKDVFNENLLRLVDTNGRYWITMTPLFGMDWIFDDLYEPWLEGKNHRILSVTTVSMHDNPHLSEEAKESILAFLDDDERQAREQGMFAAKGGLVFKEFSELVHVIQGGWAPFPDWRVYASVDHGINNPTAWLWHAVSPGGDIVTFMEHYKSDMLVREHAHRVFEIEKALGLDIYLRTGDPAMRQRQAVTGTSIIQAYANEGIYLSVDGVPREVSIGIDRMRSYLKVNPATQRPRWLITRDCPMLIKEIKKLHWKTYDSAKTRDANNRQEEIKKKDDHAPDSARYFFTLMPVLKPDQVEKQDDPLAFNDKPRSYIETILAMRDPDYLNPDIVTKAPRFEAKKQFAIPYAGTENFEGS